MSITGVSRAQPGERPCVMCEGLAPHIMCGVACGPVRDGGDTRDERVRGKVEAQRVCTIDVKA